jgi:hypothetical protein
MGRPTRDKINFSAGVLPEAQQCVRPGGRTRRPPRCDTISWAHIVPPSLRGPQLSSKPQLGPVSEFLDRRGSKFDALFRKYSMQEQSKLELEKIDGICRVQDVVMPNELRHLIASKSAQVPRVNPDR